MNSLFGNWTSTLRKNFLWLVLSTLLPTLGMINSVRAAERIYASYSALERSISINALEDYAKKGVIDDDLAVYQQYVQPQQLQELRRALVTPIKVNSVAVSQFLYTPQGEFLLGRLGEVIKSESRQPKAGFHALRSGLILASAEPGGLTLLNLLRKYPSRSIHIDLARSLGIAAELEKLVSETNRAIAAVSQKSNTEAATIQPSSFVSQLPDLRRKGKFVVKDKQTLKIFDLPRNRLLQTDIYLPNVSTAAPVIVISHGVGSDSGNFEYLANHLASYGFVVVVPNHPGSDAKQLQSLLDGRASEAAKPQEFVDRPLDVKHVLDELEMRNKSDSRFKGRLNMQQIGVIGQSFGGYTALALAGAKINFQQLTKDCSKQALKDTWNLSLLLQCRALQLPKNQYNLRDERVKAAIALNPITSSIFGKAGLKEIQTPVMIVGSSDDTIAPALYEQILPFSWIVNSQKYLVVLEGGTHFSTIGQSKNTTEQVGLPSAIVGDNPAQSRRYISTLSLPFFKTYVTGTSKYIPYLNAAYVKSISSKPVGLSLVQSLTTTELAQAVKKEGERGKKKRGKGEEI
ncbi:MAG: alpha/beta hydrolase [Tolypothrix brevis GSE-NOS-MK-07-07A]|jgi:predicted dienelactone hydrolase|nr:alpha/beta hydrolase [Tolypothrix brevis GSE-NOS-MK-07-07A]